MEFEQVQVEVPTAIGDISHVITEYVDGMPTIRYSIQILHQHDGVMRVVTGDEQPHLTPEQVQWLLTFLADQREKAQGLIPPPEEV